LKRHPTRLEPSSNAALIRVPRFLVYLDELATH
jgi:hypothetical protein